jgi:transcription termination/antitermination protein NusG
MDMSGHDHRWCAVQVRPRYEVLVSSILRNKGYEEFLPLYRVSRQWSDRRKEIAFPLFTGYVFCRLNPTLSGPIVTTPGVIRIVGTRKEIVAIPDEEIDAIRRVVKSGFKVEPCAYTIGDRVRFASGPFEGIEGIVVEHKNHRRVVVSINLIQSSISVEVDSCDFGCLVKSQPQLTYEQTAVIPVRSRAARTENILCC